MLDSVGRPAWKSGDGAGRQRGLCGPLGREVGGLSLTKAMSASRLVDYFALVSCAFHPVCVCTHCAVSERSKQVAGGGGAPLLRGGCPSLQAPVCGCEQTFLPTVLVHIGPSACGASSAVTAVPVLPVAVFLIFCSVFNCASQCRRIKRGWMRQMHSSQESF